MFFWDTVYIKI